MINNLIWHISQDRCKICIDLDDLTSDREIGNLVRLSRQMDTVHHLFAITKKSEKTVRTIDDRTINILLADQFILPLSHPVLVFSSTARKQ